MPHSPSSDRHSNRRDSEPVEENRNNGTVVHIAGVAKQVTREDLKHEFSKFGVVSKVTILKEPNVDEHRGIAFIEYTTTDEARDAISAMDNKEFEGRVLHVDMAKRTGGYKPTPGQYLGKRPRRYSRDRGSHHSRRSSSSDRHHRRRSYSRSRSRSNRKYRSRSRSYDRRDKYRRDDDRRY